MDYWSEEVEPVLAATYRLLRDRATTGRAAVCAELQRPGADERTLLVLHRLNETGYIDGDGGTGHSPAPLLIRATEKGLQKTSGWPGPPDVAPLIVALDQKIRDPDTTDDDRGRLERVRDSISALAPRLMGEILAAYAAKVLPPS